MCDTVSSLNASVAVCSPFLTNGFKIYCQRFPVLTSVYITFLWEFYFVRYTLTVRTVLWLKSRTYALLCLLFSQIPVRQQLIIYLHPFLPIKIMHLHTILSGIKGSSACYETLKIPYILSFVALHKKYPGQTMARSMIPLTDMLHTFLTFSF
jgi:hypothetical protein